MMGGYDMLREHLGLLAFGIREAIMQRRKAFVIGSAAVILAMFAVYLVGAQSDEYDYGSGEYYGEEAGGTNVDGGYPAARTNADDDEELDDEKDEDVDEDMDVNEDIDKDEDEDKDDNGYHDNDYEEYEENDDDGDGDGEDEDGNGDGDGEDY